MIGFLQTGAEMTPVDPPAPPEFVWMCITLTMAAAITLLMLQRPAGRRR